MHLNAEWVGPTREVVRQSLSITISDSELELALSTTSDDPLPGFDFGLRVDLRQVVGHTSVVGTTVAVDLYEWSDDGVAIPLAADGGSPVMPGPSVFHCSFASDGGTSTACPLQLPAVGKYALVACAADTVNLPVCSAIVLGHTQEEWQNTPLHSLNSAISMVPNKQTFVAGETSP